MRIDNRILLPFVLPFVILATLRLVWLSAGAEWSQPGLAAFASATVGIGLGGVISLSLVTTGYTIGFITLWLSRKDHADNGKGEERNRK